MRTPIKSYNPAIAKIIMKKKKTMIESLSNDNAENSALRMSLSALMVDIVLNGLNTLKDLRAARLTVVEEPYKSVM